MGKSLEIHLFIFMQEKLTLVFSFHAFNIGNMAKKATTPLFLPCTPKGVIHLLKSTGIFCDKLDYTA